MDRFGLGRPSLPLRRQTLDDLGGLQVESGRISSPAFENSQAYNAKRGLPVSNREVKAAAGEAHCE
jgi:hypothetical protein